MHYFQLHYRSLIHSIKHLCVHLKMYIVTQVGKSTLLQCYEGGNEFSPSLSPPYQNGNDSGFSDVGDSFLIKDIKIGDVTVSTHIWEV